MRITDPNLLQRSPGLEFLYQISQPLSSIILTVQDKLLADLRDPALDKGFIRIWKAVVVQSAPDEPVGDSEVLVIIRKTC